MKNISINSFIHTIFIITFISIVAVFYIFMQYDKQRHILNTNEKFNLIANSFFTQLEQHPSSKDIALLSEKLNLELILNNQFKLKMIDLKKPIYTKESFSARVRVFEYEDQNYIYIQKIGYNLFFKLLDKDQYNIFILGFIFLIIILITLTIYLIILKKLKPLKQLNDTIKKFSDGDLNIKTNIDSKDEIGKIATSFDNAIENINTLINSKTLFMRNIMHELKTPIAKGLLLSNVVEIKDSEDKKLLISIFENMKDIIEQLARVERIKTQHLNFKKETIGTKKLIDGIIIALGISNKDIKVIYKSDFIVANKELFEILLKNLIENGIKYSKDKKVEVKFLKDSVEVNSIGVKLKDDISYYTQAFTQDRKNSKGFGLGLYIVNEIAILHKYNFSYRYNNGVNSFIITQKLEYPFVSV